MGAGFVIVGFAAGAGVGTVLGFALRRQLLGAAGAPLENPENPTALDRSNMAFAVVGLALLGAILGTAIGASF